MVDSLTVKLVVGSSIPSLLVLCEKFELKVPFWIKEGPKPTKQANKARNQELARNLFRGPNIPCRRPSKHIENKETTLRVAGKKVTDLSPPLLREGQNKSPRNEFKSRAMNSAYKLTSQRDNCFFIHYKLLGQFLKINHQKVYI